MFDFIVELDLLFFPTWNFYYKPFYLIYFLSVTLALLRATEIHLAQEVNLKVRSNIFWSFLVQIYSFIKKYK